MCGILTPDSGICKINGLIPYKDRKKYVKDMRKNKIASTEMLVFFDSTGKSIVSGSFDSLLILKELQVFIPEENVLKRMLEEARKKNVKFVNS